MPQTSDIPQLQSPVLSPQPLCFVPFWNSTDCSKHCAEVVIACCGLFMVHREQHWDHEHIPLQQSQQLLRPIFIPLRQHKDGLDVLAAWKGKMCAGLGSGRKWRWYLSLVCAKNTGAMQRRPTSHPPPTSANLPQLQAKEGPKSFLKPDLLVSLSPHDGCNTRNIQTSSILPPKTPVSPLSQWSEGPWGQPKLWSHHPCYFISDRVHQSLSQQSHGCASVQLHHSPALPFMKPSVPPDKDNGRPGIEDEHHTFPQLFRAKWTSIRQCQSPAVQGSNTMSLLLAQKVLTAELAISLLCFPGNTARYH